MTADGRALDAYLAEELRLRAAIFEKARFKERPGTAFTDAMTGYRNAVAATVRAETESESLPSTPDRETVKEG